MRIAIDVMSGDNAPLELIKGAVLAADEYEADIVICGDEGVINYVAFQNDIDLSHVSIRHAPQVVFMEDAPLCVMKEKHDSSMAVGLQMLKAGEADAFISAGNTGALIAGATLIVRRIKGIKRAAIATVLPFDPPVLLVDSGAKVEVGANDLVQFGVMGNVYAQRLFSLSSARVGLLNNGTEYNKGNSVTREAYGLLSECDSIDFVGNIEGKTIPFDSCDVLVCDGFCGNVLLKFAEGMGALMIKTLKELFTKNALTMLSAVAMKSQLSELKKTFNASEYGGAPILGISKPVIKAHGSSDAYALKNAVEQAIKYAGSGIIRDISRYVSEQAEKNAAKDAEKDTDA
jgi:glycerol-3-phosphate acyltransferase PlsX